MIRSLTRLQARNHLRTCWHCWPSRQPDAAAGKPAPPGDPDDPYRGPATAHFRYTT
jgi:hypothetical protein